MSYSAYRNRIQLKKTPDRGKSVNMNTLCVAASNRVTGFVKQRLVNGIKANLIYGA